MYRNYNDYYEEEYRDDELAHYGVIGMKWGTHLSKEVRGAKKAYKEQRRKDRENTMTTLINRFKKMKPIIKNMRPRECLAKRFIREEMVSMNERM